MAQRVEVVLTDDLDGTEVRNGKGETITFGLDGKTYEIDLSARNATALRKTLKPYIDAGRKAKNSRVRTTTRTKIGPDARTVKEWARANGYQVKERGRVSKEILAAFEAAN
jgi:hypothetical protein